MQKSSIYGPNNVAFNSKNTVFIDSGVVLKEPHPYDLAEEEIKIVEGNTNIHALAGTTKNER